MTVTVTGFVCRAPWAVGRDRDRDRDRDRFAWAVAGTVIVKERLGKNEGMAQPSVRILCQPAATFVLH